MYGEGIYSLVEIYAHFAKPDTSWSPVRPITGAGNIRRFMLSFRCNQVPDQVGHIDRCPCYLSLVEKDFIGRVQNLCSIYLPGGHEKVDKKAKKNKPYLPQPDCSKPHKL